MDDGFAITITGSPLNWAGWLSQKTWRELHTLGYLVESLWQTTLTEATHPVVWSTLGSAITDALMVWALAHDRLNAYNQHEVVHSIMRNGIAGVEALEAQLGFRTLEPGQFYDLRMFADAVEAYLVPFPDHDERTLLHDVILRCRVRHPLVRRLGGMLEAVSMGELPWQEFTQTARILLKQLRAV